MARFHNVILYVSSGKDENKQKREAGNGPLIKSHFLTARLLILKLNVANRVLR